MSQNRHSTQNPETRGEQKAHACDACSRQLTIQSLLMYCPKCGDSLKEQRGVFLCERGQMELSRYMAERLYAGFVSKTEQPEDFQAGFRLGGRWFCPGCGDLMNEEEPGAIRCPHCRTNIGKYVHQLIELHPHAGK